MLKCTFLDGETLEVEFERISEHVVKLIGSTEANTSGFTLSREGHNDNWNYWSFITVYNTGDNWVAYSDDSSVYVEPNEPEVVELEPTPTQLDIIEAQVTYTAMMTDTLLEG